MMIHVLTNYAVSKRIYLHLSKLGEYLKKIFTTDHWSIEYIIHFVCFFLCFFSDSLDISLS